MNQIKIIVAGNNYLLNAGIEFLVNESNNFKLLGKAIDEKELLRIIPRADADILILDLSTITYNTELINSIKKADSFIQILVFNMYQPGSFIAKVLENGVTSYLMLHCDKDEIIQAIKKTTQGERFLCGHIVEALLTNKKSEINTTRTSSAYCAGLTISEREMEVIKCIAEGYSNQEIADKLFLSVHTITTHRRNIMNKFGVNNTAGLVMYAVRGQLVSSN